MVNGLCSHQLSRRRRTTRAYFTRGRATARGHRPAGDEGPPHRNFGPVAIAAARVAEAALARTPPRCDGRRICRALMGSWL
jgi:hypothetical protein